MAVTVIAGGMVVAPHGIVSADVVMSGGRIEELRGPADSRSATPATQASAAGVGTIDARGCFVLPGGVDPHAHLMADIAPARRAALHGGTTTALSFTSPEPGERLVDAVVRTRDELVPRAEIDIGVHASVWEPERVTESAIEELASVGATGVKLFLAFPELGMMASDQVLYET